MKAIVLAVLCAILLGGNLLALVPQEIQHNPTFCATNHADPNHRCECIKADMGEGCKDGKRDIEMRSCLAYCDKTLCSCCAS